MAVAKIKRYKCAGKLLTEYKWLSAKRLFDFLESVDPKKITGSRRSSLAGNIQQHQHGKV